MRDHYPLRCAAALLYDATIGRAARHLLDRHNARAWARYGVTPEQTRQWWGESR